SRRWSTSASRPRARSTASATATTAASPRSAPKRRARDEPRTMIPPSVVDPERPHLLGMRAPELASWLSERGVRASEGDARRILAHLISNGRRDLDLVKPVRREITRAIDARFDRQRLEIVERVTDPSDGFVKYLFRSPDGALTEA